MNKPPSKADLKRMMHSVASRSGRAARQPERQAPSLLDDLERPHARAMPACSIAQLTDGARDAIPRGSEFLTRSQPPCRFRTVYDVTPMPVAIAGARFLQCVDMPAALDLPPGCRCEIVITLESTDPGKALEAAATSPLRVHIDADVRLRAALHDALLMRALCVCLHTGGQWCQLAASPFAPVGCADNEALLPACQGGEPGPQLLAECFAFPAKFAFFDIDLKPVLARCPIDTYRLALHVALPESPPVLQGLSRAALRLGCTPVVNLFACDAEPVRVCAGHNAYPVRVPDASQVPSVLFSVDAVTHDGSLLAPVDGLRGFRPHRGWLLRHADTVIGGEDTLSFVDSEQRALDLKSGTIAIRITCTNGSTATGVPAGCAGSLPLRLLHAPTRAAVHPWHLPAADTPAECKLTRQGLPALLDLLRLYGAGEREVAGIVSLDHRATAAWLRFPQGAAYMRGIEARLTIEAAAFDERGVFAFAQVMDRFLACYAQARSFTQLVVLDTDGRELVRCAARAGTALPV